MAVDMNINQPEAGLDIEQHVLVVDTTEFSGPLDLLLDLARRQRVDLARISILELVDQYLAFINRAKSLRINMAADYLVMASWLALLKTRLLLPNDENDNEATAEELASALTWRMKRLSAMRKVGQKIIERNQLGVDFFARGQPENVSIIRHMRQTTSLFDLMQAYLWLTSRDNYQPLLFAPDEVVTINQAIDNITAWLIPVSDWTTIGSIIPDHWRDSSRKARSATASTLVASLELARRGKLDIRQLAPRESVEIRPRSPVNNG